MLKSRYSDIPGTRPKSPTVPQIPFVNPGPRVVFLSQSTAAKETLRAFGQGTLLVT
jgi:hypothetical protein